MVSVLIFPRLFLNTIFTLIEWDYVVGKTAGKAINLLREKGHQLVLSIEKMLLPLALHYMLHIIVKAWSFYSEKKQQP